MIATTLQNFDQFKENELSNRFFKHVDVTRLLAQLPKQFELKQIGLSVKGRSVTQVTWGHGPIKVMLWSQMHGDEATGTMALFDLFNFLQSDDPLVKLLAENCQLDIIPMVNPDGAEAFTRRNAQQIDINRDFLKEATAEAKILKACRAAIQPHFGFNLHDQLTLWSVSGSLKPATLSFLAPAFDQELNIDETRKNAMLVIAEMYRHLDQIVPKHIGLFDDEFEPRAFGDNFQKLGTSTILIEAGGYKDDFEKQEIRKFYFGAILAGLVAIARGDYQQQELDNYFAIPKNNKQIFHILIHGLLLDGIEVSIGINYDESPTHNGHATVKTYSIQDIGDLSYCDAFTVYNQANLQLQGDVRLYENASFQLFENSTLILAFTDGEMCQA
ncbi:M14 family zinc carboxypeptidase [Pedobacter sp. KR3-3]|uniref:M14 family zinc carboxypeptidase n=1 Tax=Pedobacter albus TaxID=3113905 RepID=A0ABU7I3M9_9SPHI|nr:M14 family zinc carboxypeptidase [Pedobacter sp. KR3-3]MEE1944072.1 M14 family zinc carboxypeptidase [Pedobacter sp. KR3-3]